MKWIGRVAVFYRPDLPRVLAAAGLLVLATFLNLLKPWPLALIIDHTLGGKPWPTRIVRWIGDAGVPVAWLAVAILLIHGGHGLIASAQKLVTIRIGLRGLRRARQDAFERLQRLSVRLQHSQRAGDLVHRAAWDTYSVQSLFQQALFGFLGPALTLAWMTGIMATLNLRLTGLAMATLPFLFLAMSGFGRRMNRSCQAAHEADAKVTSTLHRLLALLPLVQSHRGEPAETARFERSTTDAERARTDQHRAEVLYLGAVTLVSALGLAAITWIGVRQVQSNELSLGGLVVFLSYLALFFEPLSQLSYLGVTYADARAGVERVFELLDLPDDVRDAPNAVEVRLAFPTGPSSVKATSNASPRPGRDLEASIRFEGVTFGYSPDRPVLQDVSLSVAPGEVLALVGPSGAGKTTLLQLLLRFYDPQKGSIAVGNLPLKQAKIAALRSQIAIVFQEPLLLPASIDENIRYGRPDVGRGEVEAAARLAGAHDFIVALPEGYDTVVGEAARSLSLGERQRLSLARAFLKNAPIMLLDEPTSGLDPDNEALVIDGIRALLRNRTVILTAHRAATLALADSVAVLEQGRLTARGPVRDLVQSHPYLQRFDFSNRR